MKRIPISAAKRIADEYGYQQVVVIARAIGEGEHVTTYGVTKEHCAIAARMGNFIKYKIMQWPDPSAPQATTSQAEGERS